MSERADVAVVGGGPVGLYLALALLHEGLRPRVYESATVDASGSRSIGVHPPSIELFEEVGLAGEFLAHAVCVRRGLAFGERGAVGDVSFDRCPPPFPFVATLEQHHTERLLREALVARAPDALVRGVSAVAVRNVRDGATLVTEAGGDREEHTFGAVVGADGKRSVVRGAIGATFEGTFYDGEYVMADAADTTGFGDAAAVFLGGRGLVESFPLPGGRRRWVVRREPEHATGAPTKNELRDTIETRTRVRLDAASLGLPARFRAERRLASTLSAGRIVLVGDAAHVVSPIGGQGMNLGWLGARSVARTLGLALGRGRDPSADLAIDARRRRALAGVATRRAEMNMWLGRPTRAPRARELLVRALLGLPTAHLLARMFTMRALGAGI